MSTRGLSFVVVMLLIQACSDVGMVDLEHSGDEEESWAITAWGEQFEIFAEMAPLEVGETSMSHTHVTILRDFSPMREGMVTAILRTSGADDLVFPQPEILRSGIYNVAITPGRTGEFELVFLVETPTGSEEIPSARLSIGEEASSLEAGPESVAAEAAGHGEAALAFLKEQQWKTSFATEWVVEGGIHRSLRTSARIRPVAGGEVFLTAPVPGLVQGEPWPFLGMEVPQGGRLFRLTPWVDIDQSMADLEAAVEILTSELGQAQRRRSRLLDLSELGATSDRELEEAGARVVALEARLEAATLDLEMAEAGRLGGPAGTSRIAVKAPFEGQIAEVYVTPGEAVTTGARLARLVRPHPLWIEVALRPDSVSEINEVTGLIIGKHRNTDAARFGQGEMRLISVSPSVDSQTGKVRAIFEVSADTERLRIGSRVEAEILLSGRSEGIVVPTTSLVDDGGIPVVYLQVDGEGFVRRQVVVLHRQGDRAQITGLEPGGRLVTEGGNAIRRAALVATDVGEGHVH